VTKKIGQVWLEIGVLKKTSMDNIFQYHPSEYAIMSRKEMSDYHNLCLKLKTWNQSKTKNSKVLRKNFHFHYVGRALVLCNIPWLSMHGLLQDLPGTVDIVLSCLSSVQ
jgi:hypothetical protein